MRIDTQKELIKTINRSHRDSVVRNVKLYIASRKFNHVDVLDFDPFDVMVATKHYEDDGDGYTALFYNGRSRSLLDMNIPENGYNDWRCFTTREEADAYIL